MNKAFENNSEIKKIKVTSAEIVVHGTSEKPYYEIRYYDISDGKYHIGYSSYDLSIVFGWLKDCFEIVQEVEEEYNGGWIPCEKRLPDESQKLYLITYRKVFFGKFYYFTDITYLSTLSNGNKSWEIEEADKMKKVIAWQPLPEPYQPKGE